LDTSRVYTVVYWDNAAKAFYVKRFSFVESNNSPVVFISDAKGSRLVDICDDDYPQMVLTFGGKWAHRERETVDVSEFIAKKGITAKGKKCSAYDLKAVEFGEPLEKDEPAETTGEVIAEPFEADDDEPEADEPVDQVQDTEAPEAAAPAPDDPDAVSDGTATDFDDWEPTLF
jgi:topoisomerase-4 subunit A